MEAVTELAFGASGAQPQVYFNGFAPGTAMQLTTRFDEALTDRDGENLLVRIEGANHFAIVDPVDHTAARAFLDQPGEADPSAVRSLLTQLYRDFFRYHLKAETVARDALGHGSDLVSIRRR